MNACTWKITGASVPGVSHLRAGMPCQDAHAYHATQSGYIIAAVADGAGTAAQAEIASILVVREALHYLETALSEFSPPQTSQEWEALIQGAFLICIESLHAAAATAGSAVRDYATTLSLAIAGQGWLATGQIGDGAVIALTQEGTYLPVTLPQRGEYAGETYFLTVPGALDYLDGGVYPMEPAGLALMTDGLTRLAFHYPEFTPYPQFFNPLMEFTLAAVDAVQAGGELAAFLESPRVNQRTDDDKTLVIAVLVQENT